MSNPVLSQVSSQVQALSHHYEQQLRTQFLSGVQGVSAGVNWYEIFTKFIASVTQVVSTVAANPGDKRQAVIDAAVAFWKQSVAPVRGATIGMPWVFNSFIEPAIEKEIPAVAGGVYDALLSVVTRLTGPTPLPSGPAGQAGAQGPVGFTPY